MRRLSEDARPLSKLELDMHSQILQQSRASKPAVNRALHLQGLQLQQRRLMEQIHKRTMSRPISSLVQPGDLVRTLVIPGTPSAVPTAMPLLGYRVTSITDTPATPLTDRTLDPFIRASDIRGHPYTRSLSQPANLLPSHQTARATVSTPAHINRSRQIRQRLTGAANSNTDSAPNQNPPSTSNR